MTAIQIDKQGLVLSRFYQYRYDINTVIDATLYNYMQQLQYIEKANPVYCTFFRRLTKFERLKIMSLPKTLSHFLSHRLSDSIGCVQINSLIPVLIRDIESIQCLGHTSWTN